tara:strand:- start:257 stop:592 length:336 start_codon:yes stop_codon:yes gene_type:complete
MTNSILSIAYALGVKTAQEEFLAKAAAPSPSGNAVMTMPAAVGSAMGGPAAAAGAAASRPVMNTGSQVRPQGKTHMPGSTNYQSQSQMLGAIDKQTAGKKPGLMGVPGRYR